MDRSFWIIILVASILIFPREGSVSTSVSQSKIFKGFILSSSETVPSWKPVPGDEERESPEVTAEKQVRVKLEENAEFARGTFEHFAHGNHPFGIFKDFLNIDDKKGDASSLTQPLEIQSGLSFKLFLKRDIPDEIREKIEINFFLSQLSSQGAIFEKVAREKTKRLDPNHAAYVIDNFSISTGAFSNMLENLLIHRDSIQNLSQGEYATLTRENLELVRKPHFQINLILISTLFNPAPYPPKLFLLLNSLDANAVSQAIELAIGLASDNTLHQTVVTFEKYLEEHADLKNQLQSILPVLSSFRKKLGSK